MRSSIPLYDALADDYDDHFAVPHRNAYDVLAWDAVLSRLDPPSPGRPVIDAGCGVGRWAERYIASGHQVVGIEQSPRMIAAARRRDLGSGFALVEGSMEHAELPSGTGAASAIVAMGSLQYVEDPVAALARFRSWGAPGATVAVLVDSLGSLVVELARAGRLEEAEQRRASRRGVWTAEGRAADLHLFDAGSLADALSAAGLVEVEVRGLLCGWTIVGPDQLMVDLAGDPDATLVREAAWSTDPALADMGKQLLGLARVPD